MSTAANKSASDRVGTVSQFDALVVGGGPVGAAMALGLRARGLAVGLIDQTPPQDVANALGVDPRTVALSAATRALLEKLHAWPDYPVSVIEQMQVWEERGTAQLEFAQSESPDRALGYIVELSPWRSYLWRELERVGVDVQIGRVADLTKSDRWLVDMGDRQLSAPLVIAADGANSIVRRSLAVPMPLQSTGQSALASAARTSLAHKRTAYQRFLGTGPLALLPLADEHLVSVVWSAEDAYADRLAELSSFDLAAELTQATEQRLGVVEELLPAARFPLRQGVVRNFVPQPGIALIGDAARVIHPLAGQGINLGFEDVAGVLACVGGDLTWSRFARGRRARSQLVVALMSTLNSAYGSSQPALQWARNQAIRSINSSASLKRLLAREAMGLGPLAQAS